VPEAATAGRAAKGAGKNDAWIKRKTKGSEGKGRASAWCHAWQHGRLRNTNGKEQRNAIGSIFFSFDSNASCRDFSPSFSNTTFQHNTMSNEIPARAAAETATIKTTAGEMTVAFYDVIAPGTVENFKKLAR
jgi:hypothetical protein